ncbi:MAG: hypothetical protein RDU59_11200 [Thermodesulfobacteriota bacterium]|nr:hypothetical protein [Thermodesulfobacteriota bacterium]
MHLKDLKSETKATFLRYRDEILNEVLQAQNLMGILMKGTHARWTEEDLAAMKKHFARLAKRIPALSILLLPGGLLLLPILAEVLDRRKRKRTAGGK